MLEAVLKRIKYVKERSHPAKNWMAFIIVFFCYLVFCIFGDWRVCVLCVFCVAVFLTVFSVCHCVMLSGQLCQKCFRFLRTAENLCLIRQLDVVDQDIPQLAELDNLVDHFFVKEIHPLERIDIEGTAGTRRGAPCSLVEQAL